MGRRMRRMTIDEAQTNSRRVGKYSVRCRECPKYDKGFCSVFAKVVMSDRVMCDYGRLMYRSARQKTKWSYFNCKNETKENGK